MLALLHLAVYLLTYLSDPTNATHVNCTWAGPGPNGPRSYGYTTFCQADVHFTDDLHAEFRCKIVLGTAKVADWGYLRKNVLEVATPCNGGGYGNENDCSYASWGLCLRDEAGSATSSTDCLFFERFDDCEWPGEFTRASLPRKVTIWYA